MTALLTIWKYRLFASHGILIAVICILYAINASKQAENDELQAVIALTQDDAKRQSIALTQAATRANEAKAAVSRAQASIIRSIDHDQDALSSTLSDTLERLCNTGAACRDTSRASELRP